MAFLSRDGTNPVSVCEWEASMYSEQKRKWLYGTLAIMSESIWFRSTDESGERVTKLHFVNIADVKKTTSYLVFGAIVIQMTNEQKIWFSSLPNRQEVFEALHHFWHSLLVNQKDSSTTSSSSTNSAQSKTGQKLISLVKDSEDTLSKAAVQLHGQGQQIDSMISAMADIHNDLDITENLVQDVGSWLGRWRLPKEYVRIDPVVVNKSDVPEFFEYEVLMTKLEIGKVATKRIGTLRLSKDGITILNANMKNEYHFTWGDISFIRVITPWEICIVRRNLGKDDLIYNIVSANMVAVLKLLDRALQHKLRYETPPEKIWGERPARTENTREPETLKRGTSHDKHTYQDGRGGSCNTKNVEGAAGLTVGVEQIQIDQSEQSVTESEANEISRTLSGLKSLALAVGQETDVQNEKLDSLTPSVERANERLEISNKKIKRLT